MNDFATHTYFYTVRTDKGIRFYECSSAAEVIDLANQDNLIVEQILTVDCEQFTIPSFIVYGEKG